MSPNRFFAFVSLAAALVATPLCLGCGVEGHRASSGCPEGEVCSPVTPGGLVFEGRALGGVFLGGSSLHPTAIGGTQRFRFRPAVAGESLPPFRVVTSEPSVLAVESLSGASVELAAVAEGSTLLRVLDSSDDSLLDRVSVRAMPVAGARLDALDLVLSLAPEPAPIATFPGEASLFVRLVAADGTLLVDDSMELGAGSTAYTTSGHDGIEVTLPSTGFGLDLVAAGRTLHAEASVVSAITDLVVADWLLPEDSRGSSLVDAGSLFCVVPMAGATRVTGEPGATFRVDGAVVAADETMSRCIVVPGDLGETVTIEASMLSVTRAFTFPVRDRGAATSPLVSAGLPTLADLRPRARALGERGGASVP